MDTTRRYTIINKGFKLIISIFLIGFMMICADSCQKEEPQLVSENWYVKRDTENQLIRTREYDVSGKLVHEYSKYYVNNYDKYYEYGDNGELTKESVTNTNTGAVSEYIYEYDEDGYLEKFIDIAKERAWHRINIEVGDEAYNLEMESDASNDRCGFVINKETNSIIYRDELDKDDVGHYADYDDRNVCVSETFQGKRSLGGSDFETFALHYVSEEYDEAHILIGYDEGVDESPTCTFELTTREEPAKGKTTTCEYTWMINGDIRDCYIEYEWQ